MFFFFAEGLFGGPLFDRFGAKVCSFQPLEEHSLTRIGFYQVRWPPAAAYVLSVMIISICVSYYQFVLTQGVLGGLATSMAMAPCTAATAQYLNKNRGAAIGASIAGSSIWDVVFPIALGKMLSNPRLGFG